MDVKLLSMVGLINLTLSVSEPVETPSLPIKQEEKKEKKEKKEKRKKEKQSKEVSSNGAKEWVCGFSPEGYVYYYNTKSGESQWEKPEGFQDTTCNSQKEAVWVEGTDDNGRTYYYNKETGGERVYSGRYSSCRATSIR
ncbi:WW domain-binding protein 4, partial [Ophiophagus hannah]